MAYVPTVWVNDTPPPIDAVNLNKIETGLDDIHNQTTLIQATVRRIQESGGPTTLVMAAVADGEYLKRNGATIDGGTPAVSKASASIVHSEGAHYTTNSLVFVDVDAVDLSLQITTGANASVLILATLTYDNDTINVLTEFDFDVDGARVSGVVNGLVASAADVVNSPAAVTIHAVRTGLTAALHTFKLQWRVNVASNARIFCDAGWVVSFSVIEL